MTRHGDIWALIGIEPTDDVRAIRRGYAAALKQIDVDAEPDRFAALREAFEAATAMANAGMVAADEPATVDEPPPEDDRWSAQPPPDVTIIAETALPDDIATQPEPLADLPPRSPWEQAAIDDANARAGKLEDLLLTHQQGRQHANANPNPGEASAMLDHWRVLAADPRMGDLGHYAQVEAWISEIIARALPFSDPLVPVVSDYFGWVEKAAMIGQSRAVHFIVQRRASVIFMTAVMDPKHPLNRAWKELTKPAAEGSKRGFGVRRANVVKLLTQVRSEYPDLEHRFDSWRVSLWEESQAGGGGWTGGGLFFVIVILLQFVRLLGNSADTTPPYPTTPAEIVADDRLTFPRQDIDRLLKQLSHDHVSATDVVERNPDLYDGLTKLWDKTKSSGGNLCDLQAAISEMIWPRFDRVIGKAKYSSLRPYVQARLEEAQFFRSKDPYYCDQFIRGKEVSVNPPTDMADRLRNTMYDILLDSGPDRPKFEPEKTYSVSSSLIKSAAATANLDEKTFLAAMTSRGTASRHCDASIGLMTEVLKLSEKAALPVMRKL